MRGKILICDQSLNPLSPLHKVQLSQSTSEHNPRESKPTCLKWHRSSPFYSGSSSCSRLGNLGNTTLSGEEIQAPMSLLILIIHFCSAPTHHCLGFACMFEETFDVHLKNSDFLKRIFSKHFWKGHKLEVGPQTSIINHSMKSIKKCV